VSWTKVGDWLKGNSGTGAALIGSLLTGNVPAAVAAGVSLVSSATGTTDPNHALNLLQTNPAAMVELKRIAQQEEQSIRAHIEAMTRLQLEDTQAEHRETQATIRAGDTAEDPFVRRTRPAQSWLSLAGALLYVFITESPDIGVLMALLALPWTYAGLRQVGKGIDSITTMKARGRGHESR
jgi:hypothetical protein